jgi:hypothetical protein
MKNKYVFSMVGRRYVKLTVHDVKEGAIHDVALMPVAVNSLGDLCVELPNDILLREGCELVFIKRKEAIMNEFRKRVCAGVSHNGTTGEFFVDFWSKDLEHYIVSIKVSELIARNIARDLKVKIES